MFERSLVFETGEFERPKFDCICKFSESTGPTETFHVTPPWERERWKLIQNDLSHLLIVIIVNPGGGDI